MRRLLDEGNRVPPPPAAFATINIATIGSRIGAPPDAVQLRFASVSSIRALGNRPDLRHSTDANGICVPSLYAATSREAAAFESIFHDIAPTARFKTVRLSTVQSRSVNRDRAK